MGSARSSSLYAGAGPDLLHLRLDAEADDADLLRPVGSLRLRGKIEYAVRSAVSAHLYVATSDHRGGDHRLWTIALDPVTGAPQRPGDLPALALPSRPIHVAIDPAGDRVLIAHNEPAGLSVASVGPNGVLSAITPALGPADAGVFPHHVSLTPDGGLVVVAARGHSGAGARPGAAGGLHVLGSGPGGALVLRQAVQPGGPMPAFHPRQVDYAPRGRLMFVSLEPENLVCTLRYDPDGIDADPLAVVTTLLDPDAVRPRQLAGAVHVHPSRPVVYVANRADGTELVDGEELFAGGENSIAVLAVGEDGSLRLVQNAATDGLHPRCFAVHPGGTVLVAADSRAGVVRQPGGTTRRVQPGFTVFGIEPDGTLRRRAWRCSPVDGHPLWWVGGFPAPTPRPASETARHPHMTAHEVETKEQTWA